MLHTEPDTNNKVTLLPALLTKFDGFYLIPYLIRPTQKAHWISRGYTKNWPVCSLQGEVGTESVPVNSGDRNYPSRLIRKTSHCKEWSMQCKMVNQVTERAPLHGSTPAGSRSHPLRGGGDHRGELELN